MLSSLVGLGSDSQVPLRTGPGLTKYLRAHKLLLKHFIALITFTFFLFVKKNIADG